MPGGDLCRQRRPRRPRSHRRPGALLRDHTPGDDGPVTVGVDVGGTKLLGLALDGHDRPACARRRVTPKDGAGLVANLVEVVLEICSEVDEVVAVGVGLPGLVDRRGRLRFAPHLAGVVELDVTGPLAAATGLPVSVDNDATCALAAEHRLGAARATADTLLVTLGTGIGGALLQGGQLQRGAAGFAGEVGHMVVEAGGRPCPCGRHGCWERYASGEASRRLAAEAGRAPDDPVVLAQLAGWIAIGLANLVHILDVERVIVGGGLATHGEALLVPVRAAFLEAVMAPGHRPPVTVVGAELGERAGAVGAALLAREAGTNLSGPPGGG